MGSKEFAYWLMGFYELLEKGPKTPERLVFTADQVECIKRHLQLVFKHEIDPSYGPESHQQELNEIHSGGPSQLTTLRPPKPPEGVVLRC